MGMGDLRNLQNRGAFLIFAPAPSLPFFFPYTFPIPFFPAALSRATVRSASLSVTGKAAYVAGDLSEPHSPYLLVDFPSQYSTVRVV